MYASLSGVAAPDCPAEWPGTLQQQQQQQQQEQRRQPDKFDPARVCAALLALLVLLLLLLLLLLLSSVQTPAAAVHCSIGPTPLQMGCLRVCFLLPQLQSKYKTKQQTTFISFEVYVHRSSRERAALLLLPLSCPW